MDDDDFDWEQGFEMTAPPLPAGLETYDEAREIDVQRAADLRRLRRPAPVALAKLIDPPLLPYSPPVTLASARFMHNVRASFFNEMNDQFYYVLDDSDMRLVNIVPPGWAVRVGELGSFPMASKLRGFRRQLKDAGVLDAGSPLVAVVAGELDATLGTYQLYVNAMMPSSMSDVIDNRLRTHHAYTSNLHVHRPIDIRPFGELGRDAAINSLIEISWCVRNRFSARSKGKVAPVLRERPLKPAQLAEVLLWMQQRRIVDLVCTSGMKLSRSFRRA